MSKKDKFTLYRRDFLKVAGLGAGATAVATVTKTASAAPAASFTAAPFSDPAGRPKRPWWVKVVDEPTIEVDWNVMQRYNERTGTVRGPGMAGYVGDDEVDRLSAAAAKNELQRMLDNVDGYTLKDQRSEIVPRGRRTQLPGPAKGENARRARRTQVERLARRSRQNHSRRHAPLRRGHRWLH